VLRADATAWRLGVTWGDTLAGDGEPLALGTSRDEFADEIPWTSLRAAAIDRGASRLRHALPRVDR
jgi:hypothetical protein